MWLHVWLRHIPVFTIVLDPESKPSCVTETGEGRLRLCERNVLVVVDGRTQTTTQNEGERAGKASVVWRGLHMYIKKR